MSADGQYRCATRVFQQRRSEVMSISLRKHAEYVKDFQVRIRQLEEALTGSLALCRECDGRGGWNGSSDGEIPFAPCPECSKYSKALGSPASGSIPKDIDDFPGPEDFGVAPSGSVK